MVIAIGVAALVANPGESGPSANVMSASSTPPGTNYAVIKAIAVGSDPLTVAVNGVDDSIYVINSGDGTASVIDGLTGSVVNTLSLGSVLDSVAVSERTGTAYVSVYTANPTPPTIATINGSTVAQIPMNIRTYGIAVNQRDDTIYATNYDSDNIAVLSTQNVDDSFLVPVGVNPVRIAVDQGDDTVYIVNDGRGQPSTMTVLKGSNPLDDSAIVAVGNSAWGVAVAESRNKVFVANYGTPGSLSVVDGRTLGVSSVPQVRGAWAVAVDQRDDTVYVTDFFGGLSFVAGSTGQLSDDSLALRGLSYDIAVDGSGVNQGLVFVTAHNFNELLVVGRVSASGVPASGATGDSFPLSLSVADLSPTFLMDDSTVDSVSFGSTQATFTRDAGNSWEVTVPDGSGLVPVTVQLDGGLSVFAGMFSYGGSPAPDPALAPSPPLNVSGVAGDGSVLVSWDRPVDSGSFAVTNYEVVASPGGRVCLVDASELSCVVSGLVNGTAYTFEVRALNGAGWGAWSAASAPVTPVGPGPVATMVVTGSRGTGVNAGRVFADGVTTRLVGREVQARVHLSGQVNYENGSIRTVGADGTFRWQRRTNKTVYVYFRVVDEPGVRSNRLVIRPSRG